MSLAGWLIGPSRVASVIAAVGFSVWAALGGLPPVVVALIALCAFSAVLIIVRLGVYFWDRQRNRRDAAPSRVETAFIRADDRAKVHSRRSSSSADSMFDARGDSVVTSEEDVHSSDGQSDRSCR